MHKQFCSQTCVRTSNPANGKCINKRMYEHKRVRSNTCSRKHMHKRTGARPKACATTQLYEQTRICTYNCKAKHMYGQAIIRTTNCMNKHRYRHRHGVDILVGTTTCRNNHLCICTYLWTNTFKHKQWYGQTRESTINLANDQLYEQTHV